MQSHNAQTNNNAILTIFTFGIRGLSSEPLLSHAIVNRFDVSLGLNWLGKTSFKASNDVEYYRMEYSLPEIVLRYLENFVKPVVPYAASVMRLISFVRARWHGMFAAAPWCSIMCAEESSSNRIDPRDTFSNWIFKLNFRLNCIWWSYRYIKITIGISL